MPSTTATTPTHAAKPVAYYSHDRRDLYNFLKRHARRHFRAVLNVGCAAGMDAPILRSLGATCIVGIEPNEAAAAMAAQRYDAVHATMFEEWSPTVTQRFDLIVFADVLEHMQRPEQALARARTLLTEDGLVLISIPNVRCLTVLYPLVVLGEWRYADKGILDATHLRFFTARSFRRLLSATGLEVVALWRWGPTHFPPASRLARLVPWFGEFVSTQHFVLARPLA